MGVEARSETVAQGWPESGALINGVYPLLSMLHGSDRSAVFTTEARARGVAAAAIKIVRAAPVLTDLQLRHWRTATARTHPHLLPLFDSGLCQLAGQQYLFVVMEYADQTLAQLLGTRALTAEEAREMLPPALEALAFLHRKNLVHGQLKPANLLVVGDQLKLASDTIRPAGEPRASSVAPSLYDPPEAHHGRSTPAARCLGAGRHAGRGAHPESPVAGRGIQDHEPAAVPAAGLRRCRAALSEPRTDRPTDGRRAHCRFHARSRRRRRAHGAARRSRSPPAAPRSSPRVASGRRRPCCGSYGCLRAGMGGTARYFTAMPARRRFGVAAVPVSQPATPAASSPTRHCTWRQPLNLRRRDRALGQASKPPAARSRRAFRPTRGAAGEAVPSVLPRERRHPRSALNTIRADQGRRRLSWWTARPVSMRCSSTGTSSYLRPAGKGGGEAVALRAGERPDARKWLLVFEFTRAGATVHATPRS